MQHDSGSKIFRIWKLGDMERYIQDLLSGRESNFKLLIYALIIFYLSPQEGYSLLAFLQIKDQSTDQRSIPSADQRLSADQRIPAD